MSHDAKNCAPFGHGKSAPSDSAGFDAQTLRTEIAAIWQAILGCGALRDEDSFFDAGGDSVQLFVARVQMERLLGKRISATQFFETPSLGALAQALAGEAASKTTTANARPTHANQRPDRDIAIVGMSGRLPGTASISDFWDKICKGEDLVSRFALDEMEDAVSPEIRAQDTYKAVRPVLDDVDMFDAKYFGILPKEAALMDPQARVFLEICVHALEDAGIDPKRRSDAIGVFAGATMSTYMLANIMSDRAALDDFTSQFQIGNYATFTGNIADSLATRVAYKLDLKGPAISMGTACSTSLTAIAQACVSLRAEQSDVALAGGVSITFPQKRGYQSMEGGMASEDGVCRPFDAKANGTVFGHGAGVIVLKRLQDAIADGDRIYATIRGVGLNNDGADKISYTAPSVEGQAAAISMAHRDAEVTADTISYVECHGTATPLGDPIEIRGLSAAFGPQTAATCALGSVKGNIGHLDAAAGVVGVIKTALMLHHKTIPPVAHFQEANPNIEFDGGPFFVPARLQAWDSTGPRRAGISSFGIGGTNAHLVLEEAPVSAPSSKPKTTAPQILPLSAKSPEALKAMATDLAAALEDPAAPHLSDVAHTLQDRRAVHPYRAGVAAQSPAEAAAALRQIRAPKSPAPDSKPPVIFMFPGQGSQYPGMAKGLYQSQPEFARWINEGAEILEPILGLDLNEIMCLGDVSDAAVARALRDTRLTQPALFLTQYANAMLWRSRGIHPDLMIGHSVGEFAAAAVAGVMDFETGLRMIAKRGQLMQNQPSGAMLSVRAQMEEVQPYLCEGVDIAARNAPNLQVLAGPDAAIAAMEQRLNDVGISTVHLHTSHAFHSAMMDPVTDALAQEFTKFSLNAPQIPYVSCVTGDWVDADQTKDPLYWASQARATVNFQAAIQTACETRSPVMLEVGAGRTLCAFAAQTLERGSHGGIFQSLSDHTQTISDEITMATAFSNLWAAGVPVDWSLSGPRGDRHVTLPGYPFQRKRHWIEPKPKKEQNRPVNLPAAAESMPPVQVESVPVMTVTQTEDRTARLKSDLIAMLSDLSGEDLDLADADATYLELGFDSLFLGQVSQALLREYDVNLTFRALLTEYPTVTALAAKLDQDLPAETMAQPAPQPEALPQPVQPPAPTPIAPQAVAPAQAVSAPAVPAPVANDTLGLMQAQMQTMQSLLSQQLQVLGAGAQPANVAAVPSAPANVPAAPAETPVQRAEPASSTVPQKAEEPSQVKSEGFKVGRGPNLASAELTQEQISFAQELADRYSAKFPKSKALAQKYRKVHADPRTVAGFHPQWKELAFPVVSDRAKGAQLWDIDGNTFIDFVNGFGQTAFGHSPDFVTKAVTEQMQRGYPIGPQSEIAGAVAERFARMVGHERVTFCNTGSEAVMSAMRLARSVTGRDKVVVFKNDYHGQFDEVLIKGKKRAGDVAALPVAPGIPRSSLGNMVVLEYGAAESLAWIRENRKRVAAVIIEPVQSRHPDVQPVEFVKDLRVLTREIDAALVFDEVVTGFRTHARGVQGEWGIQGDMATYGKVVGGGMPIGVLAGDARFMDALDGGHWTYGDDSKPEVAPTYVAGTFVRHPLVLAAVDATLDHMERHGDALWVETARRARDMKDRMNAILAARGLPEMVTGHSSWVVLNVTNHDPRATLLYALMRYDGIHVMDGFCMYLTTAHGDAEVTSAVDAFERAVDTLQQQGILLGDTTVAPKPKTAPMAATVVAPQIAADIPLTEGQREIWMTSQMGDTASCCFNEGAILELDGDLDPQALSQAMDSVIARHDALRAVFSKTGETFTVTEPFHLDIPTIDAVVQDSDALVREHAAIEASTPFDLTAQPAIRARLLRTEAQKHVLILNAHHIVCDGWSLNILVEELAALYREAVGGAAAALEMPASFAEHAQHKAITPAPQETQVFWQDQFIEPPALPELPGDHQRPMQRGFSGATATAFISADSVKAARKAGAKRGCTLFSTLFAGLQVLLGRLSGANDVVIGVPTGGQALLKNPRLVGHCVNFLPIRAPFEAQEPVGAHLATVARAVMDAFDHQDYTFGTMVRDLDLPRALNRLPLTEVQFNLETVPEDLDMGGLKMRTYPNAKAASNFDMFFNVIEGKDGLRVDVDFNTEVYETATIQRWIELYETVLSEIARDAEQPIAAIPLSGDAELAHGPDAYADFDRSAMVHTLVDRAAAQHPEAIALEDGATRMTYGDLIQKSDALAAHIQAQVPGTAARIAVSMDRSVELVVALLAILKAGHAYLPLDPAQPEARLKLILETGQVSAVVSDTPASLGYVAELGLPVVDPSTAPAGAAPTGVTPDPEATAYVIFTSGTTGTPKGVEIPHRAVVNFLNSMAQKPGMTAQDAILSVTTVMFDIAVLELFLPLTIGARSVIAKSEDVLDGYALVDRVNRGDITMMQATPTLWDMLLDAGLQPGPNLKLLAGGEPLPADLAGRLMAHGAELWNMYGPTETTIWSAVHKVSENEPITIGHAIANTSLLILDDQNAVAPVGVVGELNIGGDGLAKGYFNRTDLTQKAFRDVTVNGSPTKLYRTGDLAKLRTDGTIEVLGRIDTQVKLRGFRIELGDIESKLRAMPAVHKVAVDVKTRKSGDRQLVAYIVATPGMSVDTATLRGELSRLLPNYMVPQSYVMLSALPQTANGKLDRKSLPDPDASAEVATLPVAAKAKTRTEEVLVDIWTSVLGLDTVATTDTLYDLGADSLMVFRIAARMQAAELNLEAKHMFEHPTIESLAQFADSRKSAASAPAGPSLKDFRNGARRTIKATQ